MQHVGFWINQHQTLLTGIVALAVGWATVHFLRKQIAQNAEQIAAEKTRIADQATRKLRSVRTGLPIALSEIHRYANSCIDFLCVFVRPHRPLEDSEDSDGLGVEFDESRRVNPPTIPTFPAESFSVLQAVVEHAEFDDAAQLSQMIAYGQIQKSRFESLAAQLLHREDPHWILTPSNVLSAIRDAVGLRLHMDRSFDYAREISPNIHAMPNAAQANDTLLWMNKGGEAVRKYVREHWPPDFPRAVPKTVSESA